MKRLILTAAAVLFLGGTSNLVASSVNNGVGFGSLNVSVWCPGRAPALPTATAGMAGVLFATGSLACSDGTGTFITGTNQVLWNVAWSWAAAGGDSVAGGGADANAIALQEMLTATLSTSGSLDLIAATTPDPSTLDLTYSYVLANSASGFSIEAYSDATGDRTPLIQVGGTYRGPVIGGGSGTITFDVTDPLGVSDIDIETDAAGVSGVPEPASVSMLLLGTGALCLAAGRRRRAGTLKRVGNNSDSRVET